jgi:hypothetical protein
MDSMDDNRQSFNKDGKALSLLYDNNPPKQSKNVTDTGSLLKLPPEDLLRETWDSAHQNIDAIGYGQDHVSYSPEQTDDERSASGGNVNVTPGIPPSMADAWISGNTIADASVVKSSNNKEDTDDDKKHPAKKMHSKSDIDASEDEEDTPPPKKKPSDKNTLVKLAFYHDNKVEAWTTDHDAQFFEGAMVMKGWSVFSISEGWVQKQKLRDAGLVKSDDYRDQLNCHLVCKECHQKTGYVHALIVGNEAHVHRHRNTQRWWGNNVIRGVCAMVQHDAHCTDPPYKNEHRILVVYADNVDEHPRSVLP